MSDLVEREFEYISVVSFEEDSMLDLFHEEVDPVTTRLQCHYSLHRLLHGCCTMTIEMHHIVEAVRKWNKSNQHREIIFGFDGTHCWVKPLRPKYGDWERM